jgi:altered-inheritance-of-mitochondria protein 5
VLTGLLEPTSIAPPQSRSELAREERSTLVETAKDRWNDELENAVRWVQRTDWTGVREGIEGAVTRVLGSERTGTEFKVDELGSATKAQSSQTSASVKSGVHDAAEAIKHSGGTIDAARVAVRDAVSKGFEMGKEAAGKAQAAVGLATEKMESKAQSSTLSHSSAVERALHERYQKSDPLSKKVEEVLEERYKPIGKRDNSVLRGV